MKASEFQKAFDIAASDADLSQVDDSILHGCALPDFQPRTATFRQLAKLIRWQARFIMSKPGGDQWDTEALTELKECLRRKLTLVDG